MDQTGITPFHKMDGHTRDECVHYSAHCILRGHCEKCANPVVGTRTWMFQFLRLSKITIASWGELTFQTSWLATIPHGKNCHVHDWYMTVLHHFIDIAVTNSYLLHKQLCNSKEEQPMTHQAFQEQLTAELCGVSLQPARESYQHLPVAISGTVGSKKATQERRKCSLYGKCTKYMHVGVQRV